MNNILNLFGQFFNQQPSANSNSNATNQNTNPTQNMSDYPEVFFTNGKNVKQLEEPSSQSQGGMLGGFFNPEMLKNFLPLLSKKDGSSFNLSSIFNNINPGLSQMFSTLSLNGKKKNKEANEPTDATIIDLKDYTEIS